MAGSFLTQNGTQSATARSTVQLVADLHLQLITTSPSLHLTQPSLIPFIIYVRDNAQFLGALAKFVLNLRATRRHRFRQLKSNGRMGHMRVTLRLVWERWRRSRASYRPVVPT